MLQKIKHEADVNKIGKNTLLYKADSAKSTVNLQDASTFNKYQVDKIDTTSEGKKKLHITVSHPGPELIIVDANSFYASIEDLIEDGIWFYNV